MSLRVFQPYVRPCPANSREGVLRFEACRNHRPAFLRADDLEALAAYLRPRDWIAPDGHEAVVIDPEFCFAGPPEFDYGVMAAHLIMADQPEARRW